MQTQEALSFRLLSKGSQLLLKSQIIGFWEDFDIHVESTFRDYDDFTVADHRVLIVEHTRTGKPTQSHRCRIGVLVDGSGQDTYTYGKAKFSASFLADTKQLYELRAKLLYPESAAQKYWEFIASPDPNFKNPLFKKRQNINNGSGAPSY